MILSDMPALPLSQPAPRLWRRLAQEPLALTGGTVLIVLLLLAVFAPVIAPHDPTAVNARNALAPPSQDHLLGTDNLGRDTLSRLLWGGRWSLGLATLVVALTAAIGTAVGLLAALAGGWVDDLLMRVVDVLLAFPGIVLALAIVGTLGPGSLNAVIGLAVVGWADHARIVRSAALSVRRSEFVQAGEALGCGRRRIVWGYLLPNVSPIVVVLATTSFGGAVLGLSTLGFLGLGAQPPTPEWGTMLEAGRLFFLQEPQLMLYPGLAVTLTAIAANLAGDGLRDALDPQLR